MSLSPLCPLEIASGKTRKVWILKGRGGNRGGVYPDHNAYIMVGVVYTEFIIGGLPSKLSERGSPNEEMKNPASESWSLLELRLH